MVDDLRRRLREGRISERELELCAYLEHAPAQLALGRPVPVGSHVPFLPWARALDEAKRRLVMRVLLSWSEEVAHDQRQRFERALAQTSAEQGPQEWVETQSMIVELQVWHDVTLGEAAEACAAAATALRALAARLERSPANTAPAPEQPWEGLLPMPAAIWRRVSAYLAGAQASDSIVAGLLAYAHDSAEESREAGPSGPLRSALVSAILAEAIQPSQVRHREQSWLEWRVEDGSLTAAKLEAAHAAGYPALRREPSGELRGEDFLDFLADTQARDLWEAAVDGVGRYAPIVPEDQALRASTREIARSGTPDQFRSAIGRLLAEVPGAGVEMAKLEVAEVALRWPDPPPTKPSAPPGDGALRSK